MLVPLRATIRLLGRALFRAVTRVQLRDMHRLPAASAFVVVTNHVSLVDAVLVALYAPCACAMMVASEWASRAWVRLALLPLRQVIPVERDGGGWRALLTALDALEAGVPVVVAPEGRISRGGVPGSGQAGAA